MRYSWKIGGPAGYGVKSAGEIFAKAFLKRGYFTFYYSEYPSLIRGGHNTVQVDVSDQPIKSSSEKIDFLLALDEETIKQDKKYLRKSGLLLYDSETCQNKRILPRRNVYPVPFSKLAKEAGGEVMRNSVALGASLALLDDTLKELKEATGLIFHKDELKKANLEAIEKGYNFIKKKHKTLREVKLDKLDKRGPRKALLTGNQAIAMGSLAGGCQFFCAYPMTPATSILHCLTSYQRKADMVVHQGEDEIGVIHEALGASFAGARSMVATSGGGLALMNEGFSLAGMTETPLVLVEVTRPAPATGLPTWTDQGDLSFVLNSGHGDFPKVVLAPGDPEEAYLLTQHAFNLAEKYQLPVVILSDKALGESKYSVELKDLDGLMIKIERGEIVKVSPRKEYKRYLLTKSGISPRSLPGLEKGEHVANSDEHDEFGFSVEGYSDSRVVQMDKRAQKMQSILKDIIPPVFYGPKDAPMTIISWGSNKGSIIDALEKINYTLPGRKTKINYLHFSYIYPFAKQTQKILKRLNKVILIEQNQSSQFSKLLRQETGIRVSDKLLKYNGKPFWPEEIISYLKKLNLVSLKKFPWKKN